MPLLTILPNLGMGGSPVEATISLASETYFMEVDSTEYQMCVESEAYFMEVDSEEYQT